jgi:hypothetical protein
VVWGGRGSSRERSTKERGGGKEEIGGAGDETGERRQELGAVTAEEIGLRGLFVAWASPLPLHILYSP